MKSSILGFVLFSLALGLVPAWSGCGDSSADHEPVGKVDLALTGTSASGKLYRLRNGVIEIAGPTAATLDTEDDRDAATIELELKVGAYTAKLNDGWRLERAVPGTSTFEPVEAVLVSPNPLPFTIEQELTTHVRLLFNAGEPIVLEHNGRAVVEIGVDDCIGPGAADCDLDGDGFPGTIDCDDSTPYVYPGGWEVCDGVDNDCDGQAEEDSVCRDLDFDGFLSPDDCHDLDPWINPGTWDSCDGVDNDCDGQVDENDICVCPGGDPVSPNSTCDFDGDGFLYFNGDCDELDASVYSGAPELCDAQDNNCDGQVDENNVCG